MNQVRIGALAVSVAGCLLTHWAVAAVTPPLHLDLEMSGSEYRALALPGKATVKSDDSLDPVLELGKRNLDFLAYLNRFRDPANPLSFSSPELQHGYPIDQPYESNPTLIHAAVTELAQTMPAALRAILFDGAEFTQTPPLAEADYLLWGRKLDDTYQRASRWELEVPFMSYYTAARRRDIRGHYFLAHEPALETRLRGWNQLEASERARLEPWLTGICFNDPRTATLADCTQKLAEQAGQDGGVWDFYQTYDPAGQALYDSYFTIPRFRSDAVWTAAQPERFGLPFVEPATAAIREFLVANIEDEWRWGDWSLHLDFGAGTGDTAHVVFEPGVNPHVNGLGGDEITMDANEPLTEYNVRWTIRHEFGHVLGFPDCYVEFFDADRGLMVSYQLDLANLMCSRRGHLQQRHYDELKRVYFH